MADIVETFGSYVDAQVPRNPARARKLLLAAYRAYGWKLRHLPDKRLPDSKNYLASVCMKCMVEPLANPGNQVLVSMFTPCESILAMGFAPMCAEQYSTYANGAGAEHGFIEAAEQAGIAETFCSYHKVVAGAALSGVMPRPAAIVNTSLACDANNLTFRALAQLWDVPQFYVDVPYRPDEDAVAYVAGQLREMTRWLGDVTGRALDEDALGRAADNSRRTIAALRESMRLRRDHFVPSELTYELYEALMTHNAMGRPETLRYAEMLRDDLAASGERPGRKVLWLHTNPFYQTAANRFFNYRRDPWVALSELSYAPLAEDTSGDPYRAMAARLVYDAYNGPVTRRAERAVEMAREIGADGAVLFCHWGCKETCGASGVIRDALEAEGVPVLVLAGDGVDRRNVSDGQTSTRIGAFLEMLEARP